MEPYKHPPMRLLLLVWLPLVATEVFCPVQFPCECESNNPDKVIIYCKDKNLYDLPDFEDSNILYYELTLADNYIGILAEDSFASLRLMRLDMTSNPLIRISPDAFRGLEEDLEELLLDVDRDENFVLEAEVVSRLTRLKFLQLRNFKMTSMPQGMLTDMTQLTHLAIHSSQMASLSASDLSGVEDSLQMIDLQANTFSVIPKSALSVLRQPFTLKLVQNAIVTLPARAFEGITHLEALDLTQNALASTSIHSEAFVGLEASLKSLTMVSCQLNHPSLQALKRLAKLEDLILYNNQITSIPSGVFENMAHLKSVDLQDCSLSSISKGTFIGAKASLQTLNLAGNIDMSISADAFQDFSLLQRLELDRASAANLDQSSLQPLASSLVFLSMKQMGLTPSRWAMLRPLDRLKTLQLTSNSLSTMEDMFFQHFDQLASLDLSQNALGDLPQQATFGLQGSLAEFDLRGNQLVTLSVCALDPTQFEQLEVFDLRLDNNPLTCDCRLIWLHRWLMEHSSDFRFYLVDWKCSDGKLFRNLKESELVCDPPVNDPVCEDLVPSTTPPSTTPPLSTTEASGPQPLRVFITNTTDSTADVVWDIPSPPLILYFTVEHWIQNAEHEKERENVSPNDRAMTLIGLRSSSTYQVCVTMETTDLDYPYSKRACTEAQTRAGSGSAVSAQMQIILGCVLGAVAFLVIGIVIIICCYIKRRNKDSLDSADLSKFPANLPSAGYNSKRFSRQKPRQWEVHHAMQSIKDKDMENAMNRDQELAYRLDGLTPEERDRMLQLMLRQSGGSTLSVASSHRYVPEPPPFRSQGAEGYTNPVDMGDEFPYQNAQKHEYEEIPADTYDQIPCDEYI